MDTQTYVVTKRAGPKVAGRVVEAGKTIELTEAEARGELIAGAIVLQPANGKTVEDPFKASEGLADIQAKAIGLEAAPAPPSDGPAPKVAKGKAAADATPGADTPPAV